MATDDLFAAVAERLRRADLGFAVIGAVALSAHGFPRQTFDFDFLVLDQRVLDMALWSGLTPSPVIRRGDLDDPLAGVVRFHDPEVDVVVGRHGWQTQAVERAREMSIGGHLLPVVGLADLVLLKLHAGGYRDAADVRLVLDGTGEELVEEVEERLPQLDAEARRLWQEVRTGGR